MWKFVILILAGVLLLCSCGVNGQDEAAVTEQGSVVEEIPTPKPEQPVGVLPKIDIPEKTTPEPISEPEPEPEPEPTLEELEALFIESFIDSMSLEQQVSQMFILQLPGRFTSPSGELEGFISESAAGGYILFGGSITTVAGTKSLTEAMNAYSEIAPFICIDEEGGLVSRLYSSRLPGYAAQPSARDVGAKGDAQKA